MEVKISDDNLEAYLTLEPGEKPDSETILKILAEKGVVFGVLVDTVNQISEMEVCEHVLIAKGIEPTAGKNTRFESLIEDASVRWPKKIKDKPVDWHKIEKVLNVNPGDKLMRRLPPLVGDDGKSVTGEVIPGLPGDDIPFKKKLSGVEISEEDPNVLVASKGGKPIITNHGVKIEPVFTCENVDYGTGSISFGGSVRVNKNVNPGMYIKSGGDVYVGGIVESALIEAEGDIIVKGGIIGAQELKGEDGEYAHGISIIRSKGMVMCLYAEHSVIEAYKTVNIVNFVLNSEVKCVEKLTVGKKGSKMGCIIGGSVVSSQGIICNTTGTSAGIATYLQISCDSLFESRRDFIIRQIDEVEHKLSRMNKMNELINSSKRIRHETSDNVQKQLEHIVNDKELLIIQLATLENLKENMYKSVITVNREINSGLHVKLGKFSVTLEQSQNGKTFTVTEDEEGNQKMELLAPM
ncbi:MAG: DUF342 domain-containing protein [Deltaproteobacteria bacterium]|nr:DUF342 domain-containing protein [Deltaproteobacteria bacterium]